MKTVLGGDGKVFGVVGSHPRYQQSDPSHVVDGVGNGYAVGENAAGVLGADSHVRDEQDSLNVLWNVDGHGVELGAISDHEAQPAQNGGGDVVGVSLDGGRHFQQFVGIEGSPGQMVGRNQSTGDGGGAASEAAAEGDAVLAAEVERRRVQSGFVEEEPHGPVNEVGIVGGQFPFTFAGDFDDRGCLPARRYGHVKTVPQVQGHSEAVETGTEVGGGGGGVDGDGVHGRKEPVIGGCARRRSVRRPGFRGTRNHRRNRRSRGWARHPRTTIRGSADPPESPLQPGRRRPLRGRPGP